MGFLLTNQLHWLPKAMHGEMLASPTLSVTSVLRPKICLRLECCTTTYVRYIAIMSRATSSSAVVVVNYVQDRTTTVAHRKRRLPFGAFVSIPSNMAKSST